MTLIPTVLDTVRWAALQQDSWAVEAQNAAIETIVKLNGRDALPLLYELFNSLDSMYEAARAIARLGDQTDVSWLFATLKNAELVDARTSAGLALTEIDADQLVAPALEYLNDPTLDWTAKWFIVIALEASGMAQHEIERVRLFWSDHAAWGMMPLW